VGELSGGVRATILRRIHGLFLNNAKIYSQDAVYTLAQRGRYVILRITLYVFQKISKAQSACGCS